MQLHGTDALVTALAAGQTVTEAARRAGLSERTAYRRLAEPDMQRRVREVRAATFARTLGLLSDATAAAVETLVRNLDAVQPAVQVRAAVAVLEQATKLRAGDELERHVAELEAAVAAEEGGTRAAA